MFVYHLATVMFVRPMALASKAGLLLSRCFYLFIYLFYQQISGPQEAACSPVSDDWIPWNYSLVVFELCLHRAYWAHIPSNLPISADFVSAMYLMRCFNEYLMKC